jgi:hypothetical protein
VDSDLAVLRLEHDPDIDELEEVAIPLDLLD